MVLTMLAISPTLLLLFLGLISTVVVLVDINIDIPYFFSLQVGCRLIQLLGFTIIVCIHIVIFLFQFYGYGFLFEGRCSMMHVFSVLVVLYVLFLFRLHYNYCVRGMFWLLGEIF